MRYSGTDSPILSVGGPSEVSSVFCAGWDRLVERLLVTARDMGACCWNRKGIGGRYDWL